MLFAVFFLLVVVLQSSGRDLSWSSWKTPWLTVPITDAHGVPCGVRAFPCEGLRPLRRICRLATARFAGGSPR